MQLTQVGKTCRPELDAAELGLRNPCAGIVPGPDQQVVARARRLGTVPEVLAVVLRRAGLSQS